MHLRARCVTKCIVGLLAGLFLLLSRKWTPLSTSQSFVQVFKDDNILLEEAMWRGGNVPDDVLAAVQDFKDDNIPLEEAMWRGENVPDDVLAAPPPSLLPKFRNPCWHEASRNVTRLRCMPYFYVIGADKCGTTDLWDRLTKHSQVLPNLGFGGKETHWWSWRRFGFDIWVRDKPIQHFKEFLAKFDAAAARIDNHPELNKVSLSYHPLVTGEASPTTFWDFTGWNLIPQNEGRTPETALVTPHCMHHLTPDVKLILILRNPTDRLFSDYLFLDRFRSFHNVSVAGFHEAVVTSLAMYEACVAASSVTHCIYDKRLHMNLPVRLPVGLYSEYLKVWLSVFPRSQLLILRTEDYSRNLIPHLELIFRFLQLEPVPPGALEDLALHDRRSNARASGMKSLGDMWNSTRTLLHTFYRPYNLHLAAMLGDSRFSWEDFP